MTTMRDTRQSNFWLVCAVLAIGQCCFGQVLDGPDSRQEQFNRYTRLYKDARWAEALETLQSFSSSDSEYINHHVLLRILTGNYDEASRLVDANEPAINDAWSLAALGRWYLDKSPNKCRTYLTKSLAIDPTPFGIQVAIDFADQQNDLRFAMESLRKLHKRHPRYMGGYVADNGFQLDKEDRKFGTEQVTRVCRDRPKLAPLIEGSPRIKEWLIRRFGGMFIGRHANWSNARNASSASTPNVTAYHTPADQDSDAVVWVNPDLNGEHQLAALIYELLNAENSDEIVDLWEKILRGEIDKESWMREIGKLEHRVFLKSRAFVVVEYFAGGLPDTISPKIWCLNVDVDFDKYFKLQPKFINDYYSKLYEEIKNHKNVGNSLVH